jgi:hypothetical protein
MILLLDFTINAKGFVHNSKQSILVGILVSKTEHIEFFKTHAFGDGYMPSQFTSSL